MHSTSILEYCIGRTLGSGAFGYVYYGVHEKTKKEAAVKVANSDKGNELLKREADVYQILSNATGFAKMIDFSHNSNHNYSALVFELLGKNIRELYKSLNKKFTLKTILMFADQAILRLEYLHRKGIIHGDVKPENFCAGLGPNSGQIYLVDFGLNSFFSFSSSNSNPIEYSSHFQGTANFASIATHNGVDLQPKDDLESLVYTLLYLINGKLPWNGIKKAGNNAKVRYTISMMKRAFSLPDLCNNIPSEIQKMFEDILNLKRNDIPDYAHYRRTIRETIMNLGLFYNNIFDWMECRLQPSFSFNSNQLRTQLQFQKKRKMTLNGVAEDEALPDNINKSKEISKPFLKVQQFQKKQYNSSYNVLGKNTLRNLIDSSDNSSVCLKK